MNGHIYCFIESGTVTRESGLNFISGWEYIYLPILMTILLGWTAYIFSAKKLILLIAILGLLFSSYIHYDLLGIGHTIYVIILGIFAFLAIRYLKQASEKEKDKPEKIS